MKNLTWLILVFAHLSFADWSRVDKQYSIAINPAVKIDTHVAIYTNSKAKDDTSVLAIHGFTHSGATYDNLIELIKSKKNLAEEVHRIFVLDLPNRGGSGLPNPPLLPFGLLQLSDYTNIVLGTLDSLKKDGYRVNSLIGHSMGGLLIQRAQDHLLTLGKSLRKAYRIRKVLLLNPVIPANLPWELADSGTAEFLFGAFTTNDPTLGDYIEIPIESWIGIFLGNLAQEVSPTAPTPQQIIADGYRAIEPAAVAFQLAAQNGRQPLLNRRIFKWRNGTRLFSVSTSQDNLVAPNEISELHKFLGGRPRRLFPIEDDFAVHDTYISSPKMLVRPLRRFLRN